VSKNNVPDLTCYNLDIHEPTTISGDRLYKKLIRRWDSERELFLWRQCTCKHLRPL